MGAAKLPHGRMRTGSIHLTNERIHEILDEQDIARIKRSWDVPS
jgi:hypothetical protein